MAEVVDDGAEAQVVGPEVVAPRRDAVGLVDHEQAGTGAAQRRQGVRSGELLGREEAVLEPAVGQPLQHVAPLARLQGAVQLGGGAALQVVVVDGLDLVVLQGDEGADDDGGPVEQQAGHLVDGRLARPGGHHGEGVVAGEDRLDRLPLPGTQVVEAEAFSRQLDELVRHVGA